MAQTPPQTRQVHDRLADRLKYCAIGLTDVRFMTAITYFHNLSKHRFTLSRRAHPASKDILIGILALESPVHTHIIAAGHSTSQPDEHAASPVFEKLDAQLAMLCSLKDSSTVALNDIPRLLLDSMDSHKERFQLVHHTRMHGAEVAHNSVWTFKNMSWPISLNDAQKQSLETLLFLMGCAHDSIFTRARGYDEAASALLLIHLLNLDSPPEGESRPAQQAREDLIKIIYYIIVGGTYPIIPKNTQKMVALAHQTENEESIQETTTDIGIHYPRDQDRRAAYATPTISSASSPMASSDIHLLKLFRLALTFSDVNATSNANTLSSCATPPEQAITATSMSATLSLKLKLDSALHNDVVQMIGAASNHHPAIIDAAFLCLGQGTRVMLEDSWELTDTLRIKDLKDYPPAVTDAIIGLTAIYHSLVAAHHDSEPSLNSAAHAALYTAENIKNILKRLIAFFKGEAGFTNAFLANGFNAEFSDKPIAGANFWPMASKIYNALAVKAAALLDDTPAKQREFILYIMGVASYQHGSVIATSIMSPDFDLHHYVNAIGKLQRDGLAQAIYSPRNLSYTFTLARTRAPTHLSLPPVGEHLPLHDGILVTDADAAETALAEAAIPAGGAPQEPPLPAARQPDPAPPVDWTCGCAAAFLNWWRGNRVGAEAQRYHP